MESKTQYRIMKLRSGEEIITRIVNSSKDKLTVERPMCFRSLMIQDYYGTPKEILVMKNWIPLSVENRIEIPKDSIMSYMTPNPDAISLYEAEKEKEDTKVKLSEFKKANPVDEDEDFKKMMKYLSENTQKLDDMMKDMTNSEAKQNDKTPQGKEDMIFMNMMFPPEMLIDLIESDIIDPEIFGEMYQDIKKNMKRKKKPSVPPKNKKATKKPLKEDQSNKYTGEEKNHKDYGNRWTDWNPDLSSEDYQ
jgi:hypothetical protein